MKHVALLSLLILATVMFLPEIGQTASGSSASSSGVTDPSCKAGFTPHPDYPFGSYLPGTSTLDPNSAAAKNPGSVPPIQADLFASRTGCYDPSALAAVDNHPAILNPIYYQSNLIANIVQAATAGSVEVVNPRTDLPLLTNGYSTRHMSRDGYCKQYTLNGQSINFPCDANICKNQNGQNSYPPTQQGMAAPPNQQTVNCQNGCLSDYASQKIVLKDCVGKYISEYAEVADRYGLKNLASSSGVQYGETNTFILPNGPTESLVDANGNLTTPVSTTENYCYSLYPPKSDYQSKMNGAATTQTLPLLMSESDAAYAWSKANPSFNYTTFFSSSASSSGASSSSSSSSSASGSGSSSGMALQRMKVGDAIRDFQDSNGNDDTSRPDLANSIQRIREPCNPFSPRHNYRQKELPDATVMAQFFGYSAGRPAKYTTYDNNYPSPGEISYDSSNFLNYRLPRYNAFFWSVFSQCMSPATFFQMCSRTCIDPTTGQKIPPDKCLTCAEYDQMLNCFYVARGKVDDFDQSPDKSLLRDDSPIMTALNWVPNPAAASSSGSSSGSTSSSSGAPAPAYIPDKFYYTTEEPNMLSMVHLNVDPGMITVDNSTGTPTALYKKSAELVFDIGALPTEQNRSLTAPPDPSQAVTLAPMMGPMPVVFDLAFDIGGNMQSTISTLLNAVTTAINTGGSSGFVPDLFHSPPPVADLTVVQGVPGCDVGGWFELMLYQARCIRWFHVNCLCDYDKLFRRGSALNYVMNRAGAKYELNVKRLVNGTYQNSNIPSTFYWPLVWRGNLDNSFGKHPISFTDSSKGLASPTISTGLDNAQPGNIVLWRTVPGMPRHAAYVEAVSWDTSTTAATGATGQKYVWITEANYGKWPDTCGNTLNWGVVQQRFLYSPDSLNIPKGPDGNVHPCTDSDYTRCVENNWNSVEVYDPLNSNNYYTDQGNAKTCSVSVPFYFSQQDVMQGKDSGDNAKYWPGSSSVEADQIMNGDEMVQAIAWMMDKGCDPPLVASGKQRQPKGLLPVIELTELAQRATKDPMLNQANDLPLLDLSDRGCPMYDPNMPDYTNVSCNMEIGFDGTTTPGASCKKPGNCKQGDYAGGPSDSTDYTNGCRSDVSGSPPSLFSPTGTYIGPSSTASPTP